MIGFLRKDIKFDSKLHGKFQGMRCSRDSVTDPQTCAGEVHHVFSCVQRFRDYLEVCPRMPSATCLHFALCTIYLPENIFDVDDGTAFIGGLQEANTSGR